MRNTCRVILFLFCLLQINFSFAEIQVTKFSTPAGKTALAPYLLKDGQSLWMSWIERGSKKLKVKVANWNKGKWSPTVTVVESKDIMANWADFPSLQKGGDGALYLHWLKKISKTNVYGYVVQISRSDDSGKTWKHLGRLHKDDNFNAEHGFVSLVATKTGVRAFWLDGGKVVKGKESMQLRTAEVGKQITNEMVVDERVCSCCGTVGIATTVGPVIFYRDRSEKEIRDIYMARFRGKTWQRKNASNDGWEIHGCPVNGPDADTRDGAVALAWYSGGGEHPGVKLSFSSDMGNSFSKSIAIDDFLQGSLGRVQVLLTKKNEALITWMKSKAGGRADLYVRRIHSDGRRGTPVVLAEVGASRGVGFPQLKDIDGMGLLVWTVRGKKQYDAGGIKMIIFDMSKVPQVLSVPLLGEDAPKKTKMRASLLAEGEYIADFSALDLNGKKALLSKYRGKTVLINYWASWCDACIEEFGLINDLQRKYSTKGLEIVMINVDTDEDWPLAKKLIRQAKLLSTVWRDPLNSGAQRFGYAALPFTALVDSHLKLRFTMTGSLLSKKPLLSKRLKYLLKIK